MNFLDKMRQVASNGMEYKQRFWISFGDKFTVGTQDKGKKSNCTRNSTIANYKYFKRNEDLKHLRDTDLFLNPLEATNSRRTFLFFFFIYIENCEKKNRNNLLLILLCNRINLFLFILFVEELIFLRYGK